MSYQQRFAEAYKKAFADFHLVISPRCRIKEVVQKVYELARVGTRSKDIAEQLGMTTKTVCKIYRRYNFPRLSNICPRQKEEQPMWKGGVHKTPEGYLVVRRPDHPYSSKTHHWVRVHRLVVEEHIGRYLLPTEVVHHIDGNPANNDISNLEVFSSNGEHLRATLKGIPHHMSEEGRCHLSQMKKAEWASGKYRKIFSSPEYREKKRLETLKKWEDGVYANRDMSWVESLRTKHNRQSSTPSPSSTQKE